jgi:O-acetylhomoserine (thiol)-lyase
MPEQERRPDFETRQIHAGALIDAEAHARVTPIYQAAGYLFESFDDGEDLFAGRNTRRAYSCNDNPINAGAGRRDADLEGGVDGILVANGYEGTREMFRGTLKRQGLDVEYVPDAAGDEEWASRFRPTTKAVYTETPPTH